MKKDKKTFDQLTHGEKYRYYRKRRNLTTIGKWGSIVTPFGVIFGVKFNEYVQILDTAQTVKLSIGCVLALAVAVIAIYKEFKHSEKSKHLAPAIGWGVALAFAWLFEVILQDLVLILASEFAGQCVAAGFDSYSAYANKEMEEEKTLARQDNTLHKKSQKKIKVKVVK